MIGSETLVPEAPTGSGTVVSVPALADAEAMFTPSSRKERNMRSYALSLRSGSLISMRALSGVGGGALIEIRLPLRKDRAYDRMFRSYALSLRSGSLISMSAPPPTPESEDQNRQQG